MTLLPRPSPLIPRPLYNAPVLRRQTLLIATVAVAITIFFSPFQRELFIGDETKYAQVIREMREGSILVMTLHGEPYGHKPPVHFWIIALLSYPFGLYSIWPFVLQSLLSYLIMLLLIQRFGLRLFGDPLSAAAAPLIFATFLLAWGLAQTARMDMSFVLLLTVAILFVFRFLETSRFSQLYIAALAIAVAILIKGPMAFVMVAVLILLEWWRRGSIPGGRGWLLSLLIVLIGPLLWLVPAIIATGADFAHEILVRQNVGRAVGSWVHREPFWFYLARFPITYFPWSVAFLFALVAIFRREWSEADRNALRFCVNWLLAVILPFSFLSGKLDIYMLPALIPAALIAGRFLAVPLEDRWSRFTVLGNRVVVVILGLLMVAALFVPPEVVRDQGVRRLMGTALFNAMFVVAALAALAGLIVMMTRRGRSALASSVTLALVALVPLVYLTIFLIEPANEMASTRPIVRVLARYDIPPEEIALFSSPYLWTRQMPRHLERVRFIGRDGLDERHGPPPEIVVTRSSDADRLGPLLREQYLPVEEFRMMERKFDVYRRR
jgi:4-amino-4-deoxy-L-arabinose transferase-like glycosyltransferase